jgi:hypothetical protein
MAELATITAAVSPYFLFPAELFLSAATSEISELLILVSHNEYDTIKIYLYRSRWNKIILDEGHRYTCSGP